MEPGQSIYGHNRLSCTGSLTVERQQAISVLEPTLTRHGYTAKVLTEMLGTKLGKISRCSSRRWKPTVPVN